MTPAELGGRRFACVLHRRRISLTPVHPRLRGVGIVATIPVLVGESGGRPAVMGELPDAIATEREVHAFVDSLLKNGQVAFGGDTVTTRRDQPLSRVTHRIASVSGQRTLQRVRFHCR